MLENAAGNIDYDEEGSGPTILFVPGSWGTGSAWRGVIAALGGRFRTVTTSLLGYGRTAERRTAADASIELEADIVETVARHTGERVHIVGHSYGGLVCLAVALRSAVPLASLTLIEPVVFDLLRQDGDLPLFQKFAAMRESYFAAYANGDKKAARQVIDFFSGAGSFDALPLRMRDYVVATTPAHALDMRAGLEVPLSAYSRLSLPTLVLRGEQTHTALGRSAEILSRAMPNASLVTIAGASHFMMATHAADVAREIEAHLSRVETSG